MVISRFDPSEAQVTDIGELRKYKIGEIAKLAGVSKRTIDYYTNRGLLTTMRSGSNYRYYSSQNLVRLKIVEGLKRKRYTLDEIKQTLDRLSGGPDKSMLAGDKYGAGIITIDVLKDHYQQLENQVAGLHPLLESLETDQAAAAAKQVMIQGLSFIQELMLFITDVTPLI